MEMKKLLAAALALSASGAWAAQGTVYTENGSQSGDIRWQPKAKTYLVSYKKGNTNVSAEFPLADVKELDVAKPDGFDKLVGMVRSGSGPAAVRGLEAIVKEYRMLDWDKKAGRYLVEAYLASGKAQQALSTAENMIMEDAKAAYSGDLAPAYWQALLKLNKTNKLEECLKKAAASGSRAASAEALIMRGDMILATEGDNIAAHRKALVDGYLRVAIMYNDPPCKEARRDAMLRCATSFEKIGMGTRAENMRTESAKL